MTYAQPGQEGSVVSFKSRYEGGSQNSEKIVR
jgi:hypothetical protein